MRNTTGESYEHLLDGLGQSLYEAELREIVKGMMAGDAADIAVIREIESQPRKCWKKYAQAFTGLSAQDIQDIADRVVQTVAAK